MNSPSVPALERKDSNSLCLDCGLCCNGAIFADVKLQPGDDRPKLKQLGLPLLPPARVGGLVRFRQPCVAHRDGLCQIYPNRPKYCRDFECLLLKRVQAGDLEKAVALRTIQTARALMTRLHTLLVSLGENDQGAALKMRFQRVNRRLQTTSPDASTADLFGQLTVAFHELNLLLSRSFCPDGLAV